MKTILVIAIISVLTVSVSITSISAQSQYDIPSWVKGIAGFWVEEKISDQEFGEGVSFLINEEIIKVPEVERLKQELAHLKSIDDSDLEDDIKELELKNTDLEIKITELEQYVQKLEKQIAELTQSEPTPQLEPILPIVDDLFDPTNKNEHQNSPTIMKIAERWSMGKISDKIYLEQHQDLIDSGFIPSFPESARDDNTNEPIPSWIKNNAGWYAENIIHSYDYYQGLTYLYKTGFLNNP